jgi:hypothetical protein
VTAECDLRGVLVLMRQRHCLPVESLEVEMEELESWSRQWWSDGRSAGFLRSGELAQKGLVALLE